jgi:hypothetical protein
MNSNANRRRRADIRRKRMERPIITPGVLNIGVEARDGPQDTSFYLPQPVPGGIKVTMFGGWSKVDALAAHILAMAVVTGKVPIANSQGRLVTHGIEEG